MNAMNKNKGVFSGLLVLDFCTTVTGPGAAMSLANYGATVIKVESQAHVETLRISAPFAGGKVGINRSGYFAEYNAGKLGLALNMTTPKGVEIAKRLVAHADVVMESNRVGVMKKWGLDYEVLKKVKPDLIMISTTTLGQYGPHCMFRGYGTQGAAMSGWGNLIGWADRAPTSSFGAYTDSISIRYVAIAVIAALEYRRRTGKGTYIDHSQAECSLQFQVPLFLDYAANGRLTKVDANRDPNAAPHGAYRCLGDDRWCAIAVTNDDEWQAFCKVIGSPSWTKKKEFTTFSDRKAHEDDLDTLVEQWTVQHKAEDVMRLMQEAGVGAALVESSEDMFNDPQLQHRKHFVRHNHAEMGLSVYEDFSYRLMGTPGGPSGPAPCLGEHSEYVCKEILGMSDEEFVQLLTEGVLQ
jgi:benzylsuccinate CoA-transferase BbsF subunit